MFTSKNITAYIFFRIIGVTRINEIYSQYSITDIPLEANKLGSSVYPIVRVITVMFVCIRADSEVTIYARIIADISLRT